MKAMTFTLACFVATAVHASDREPVPVDPSIIDNPAAKDVGTLLGSLRGCGCRPRHHPVRDAIVKVGRPAVPGLVKQLNSSTQWWVQLECIYLLGLIGPDAEEAIPALEKAETVRHGLPKSYIPVALAAIRADDKALAEVLRRRGNGAAWYAAELLGGMGANAAAARPLLVDIAATGKYSASRRLAQETIQRIDDDQK